jgi:hypothetical protein
MKNTNAKRTEALKTAMTFPSANHSILNIAEDLIKESSKEKGKTQDKNVQLNRIIELEPFQEQIDSLAQELGISIAEMMAWMGIHQLLPPLIVVNLLKTALMHQLNVLANEVSAKKYEDGQWQISISVDGWIKIINRHPAFSAITFEEGPENAAGIPNWMKCAIYRSDRTLPIEIKEYFDEVKQDLDGWQSMPRRMLRHRALQQCARIALGSP